MLVCIRITSLCTVLLKHLLSPIFCLQLKFKFKVFGCKWSFETSVGGKSRNVSYDTLRPVTRFFANVLFGKEMVIRLLECEGRLLCSGALRCSAPFFRCKCVFCRQRPVCVWCPALQPLMGVVLCDLALIPRSQTSESQTWCCVWFASVVQDHHHRINC